MQWLEIKAWCVKASVTLRNNFAIIKQANIRVLGILESTTN